MEDPLFLSSDEEALPRPLSPPGDLDLDRLFDDDVVVQQSTHLPKENTTQNAEVDVAEDAQRTPTLSKQNSNQEEGDSEAEMSSDRVKTRRIIAKLDCDRLCGTRGIRLLRHQTRDFQAMSLKRASAQQSKRNTQAMLHDFDAILSRYRLWAHQCLPKVAFRDFERNASKLCRSRRMHHFLTDLKSADLLGKRKMPDAPQSPLTTVFDRSRPSQPNDSSPSSDTHAMPLDMSGSLTDTANIREECSNMQVPAWDER